MKYNTALLLLLTIFCWGLSSPAKAQTIIRDTEIEDMMEEWFAPIFKAAGMDSSQVDIILIQDDNVNAFVAGGANIFFHTGLLQKTDNPGEVIGVMAHELGHIEGSHLVRARDAMENASYESIIGMIVGAAAGLATGEGGAVATVSQGANSMAQRRFLSEARKYEASADQAAIRSMTEAGINPKGLATFLEKLQEQESAPSSLQSEYVRTHPLTESRVDAVEARWQNSPLKDKALPAAWVQQHKRMKAKLLGYLNPGQIPWTYDDRDTSLEATYARAIAAYRESRTNESLQQIDSLLAKEPNNPYFHELQGDVYFNSGQFPKAIAAYKKSLATHPDAPLVRIALGRSLIENAQNNQAELKEAITHLQRAEVKERRSSQLHRLMATAYGRMGNDAAAQLHLAEEAVLQRRYADAKGKAEYARDALPKGSREWIRAQDILNFLDQQKI